MPMNRGNPRPAGRKRRLSRKDLLGLLDDTRALLARAREDVREAYLDALLALEAEAALRGLVVPGPAEAGIPMRDPALRRAIDDALGQPTVSAFSELVLNTLDGPALRVAFHVVRRATVEPEFGKDLALLQIYLRLTRPEGGYASEDDEEDRVGMARRNLRWLPAPQRAHVLERWISACFTGLVPG